jgi:hypothetical protein
MDVDHRNFGEYVGLDQRPIGNHDADIDRGRMMFDEETLDIVHDGDSILLREQFHGAASQIGSSAPSLVWTRHDECDLESILDQGSEHSRRDLRCTEKGNPSYG